MRVVSGFVTRSNEATRRLARCPLDGGLDGRRKVGGAGGGNGEEERQGPKAAGAVVP